MRTISLHLLLFISLASCVDAPITEETLADGDSDKVAENVELNGKVLYQNNCIKCHGDLLTSDKTDATPSQIQVALNDIVRMNHLNFLSGNQIIQISNALSSSDPSRVHPQITSASPNGAFIGATQSLNLQVATDMVTACKYDTRDLTYDDMSYQLISNSSKLSHSKNIPLSPGATYQFYVHCKEPIYGNVTKVSQFIRFSTDLDAVDTTPPVLSITPPSAPLLGGTTTAQIYLNTNEFSNCRFSTDSNDSYNQMINMESTGTLGHVHTLRNLENGKSYDFYTYCSDPTGNISSRGTISISVDSIVNGALLYANNCIACHGNLSSSSKRNATSIEIKDAIRDVGRMKTQYLEFLSDEQIDAISDAL